MMVRNVSVYLSLHTYYTQYHSSGNIGLELSTRVGFSNAVVRDLRTVDRIVERIVQKQPWLDEFLKSKQFQQLKVNKRLVLLNYPPTIIAVVVFIVFFSLDLRYQLPIESFSGHRKQCISRQHNRKQSDHQHTAHLIFQLVIPVLSGQVRTAYIYLIYALPVSYMRPYIGTYPCPSLGRIEIN